MTIEQLHMLSIADSLCRDQTQQWTSTPRNKKIHHHKSLPITLKIIKKTNIRKCLGPMYFRSADTLYVYTAKFNYWKIKTILSFIIFQLTVESFSISLSEAPSDARPISWENWAKLGSASSGMCPRSSWIQSLKQNKLKFNK